MTELTHLKARIRSPGCDATDFFEFLRGGKQGGVDTPDLFNIMIEYLLHSLVLSWDERGFGVPWVSRSNEQENQTVNHLIWCDNVWLIATNRHQLETMILEITDAIHKGGFRWKPSSLQTMAVGDAQSENMHGISCTDIGGAELPRVSLERDSSHNLCSADAAPIDRQQPVMCQAERKSAQWTCTGQHVST